MLTTATIKNIILDRDGTLIEERHYLRNPEEVHLITGRSHQIRAHLSSIGHPIIGDMKYGDKRINAFYKENYHVTSQLLHAHHVILPDGRYIEAALPDIWSRVGL